MTSYHYVEEVIIVILLLLCITFLYAFGTKRPFNHILYKESIISKRKAVSHLQIWIIVYFILQGFEKKKKRNS